MKILVIGATGFIGKSIYNFLKIGEYEVVASSRQDIDFSCLQDDKELVN
ncbi:MAG TPA: NAD-dependent epimerase/dehydratase family protein, partial [Campylobacterales bacterium]|nr:NAD-dependent epimerase/dehydratase family protein [Campylobacterales bacterium]